MQPLRNAGLVKQACPQVLVLYFVACDDGLRVADEVFRPALGCLSRLLASVRMF
jgi:hypothetical protein